MITTGLLSKGMNVPTIYEEHLEILVLTISDFQIYLAVRSSFISMVLQYHLNGVINDGG